MPRYPVLSLPALCLLLTAMPLLAAGAAKAPPPPPGVEGDVEPQVTIIHRRGETIEEYRINGQLYMIKVTPRTGIPYYLVDSDGDGNFDVRSNELDPELLVPQWTILRW